MPALLSSHDLSVHIGRHRVVNHLQLNCHNGELWGLLGPNGSGKTTLLMTLAGIRAPLSGKVLLQEKDMSHLSRRHIARQLGMLQQHLPRTMEANVMQMALMGRHPHLSPWALEQASDCLLARQALARVDLAGLEKRAVRTLSGGEARRLAFATLLVQDPQLMLLDEPTNHLDLHHQLLLLDIVKQRVEDGAAAIMATHDINVAATYCSHVILLYGDGSAECGRCADLLDETRLSRLYDCRIRHHRTADADWYAPHPG